MVIIIIIERKDLGGVMSKDCKDTLQKLKTKVGDNPFYLKFWLNRPPLERNRRFWTDMRRSASSVTPSKKIQLTLIGSPLRAFQWA